MNIELIIFLATWLVSTEVLFFAWERNAYCNFFGNKMVSVIKGLLVAIFIFGLPWLLAVGPIMDSYIPLGPIVYAWYYGVALAISAFFGINYAIHKWMDKKGIGEKRQRESL